MNAQQIIERARRLSHTDQEDYTNDNAVEDLNLVYQDLIDRITVISKWDYFWDLWITNTIAWQSEYLAKKLWLAPDDLDIKKINKVFIKYTSDAEYFTKVSYVAPSTLEEHPDYYKDKQSKSEPFFYIQDQSIFIYPAPEVSVVDWLEIFVIHKPASLDIDSTEENIEIPSQFHKILSDGIKMYIYQSNWQINEAKVAEQDYEKGIDDMVRFMKQRYNQPKRKVFTNLVDFR